MLLQINRPETLQEILAKDSGKNSYQVKTDKKVAATRRDDAAGFASSERASVYRRTSSAVPAVQGRRRPNEVAHVASGRHSFAERPGQGLRVYLSQQPKLRSLFLGKVPRQQVFYFDWQS